MPPTTSSPLSPVHPSRHATTIPPPASPFHQNQQRESSISSPSSTTTPSQATSPTPSQTATPTSNPTPPISSVNPPDSNTQSSPSQHSSTPISPPLRRSTRRTQGCPPQRLGYNGSQGCGYLVPIYNSAFSASHNFDLPSMLEYFAYQANARSSDPDTLTYDQAMLDNPIIWMEAAAEEICSLEERETWDEVDRSEAKSKILPGTWVFRRKRTPDGVIKKNKGRYCV